MPPIQTPPTFNAVTTGSKEFSVELNDAVFDTKAWRTSRYDGSLTKTTTINKLDESNDITYGKTTAVQKYSRNIYIGTNIVGMDNELAQEDSTLTTFPNFSYAQTNAFITIDENNEVNKTEIEANLSSPDAKRGFYRSFHEDFPEGNTLKIIILDESLKQNLEDFYSVYFNGGRLQHLIRFDYGGIGYNANYNKTDNTFVYANSSGLISASSDIINKDILIDEFFTGSLIDNVILYAGDSQTPLGK
tara:strand:- start:3246 stop:3983 length:738 start_codon:yes stop_codon:yes gene_type:complete